MGLTLRDFIQQVLINEIRTIQQTHGHHYLSFGLIAQGIELLGACLDSKSFHKKHTSADRFRAAIKQLFPEKYQPFNHTGSDFDLYSNLRCGLLHVVLPGSFVELIQECEKEKYGGEHLKVLRIRGKDRLLLVSQDLYVDFANAAKEVISRIDSGSIDPKKATGFLIVTEP